MHTFAIDAAPRHYPPSWYAASAQLLPPFTPLQGDIQTDVCVIGGGYTGLSTALHLRKKGYDVVVLDAERVGWGASGRDGGHVGTGQRADQTAIEKWVGLEAAKGLWQLSLEAVQRVCDLIDEYQIDCELGSGNLHFAAKPSHAGGLQDELEHLETVYGYEQLSYVSADKISELSSARGFHGALLDNGCHGVSRSLYCHDPDGIEFEVMWEVPVELLEDHEPENVPLDFEADRARFGADTPGNGAR